jgi:hypothetical protein
VLPAELDSKKEVLGKHNARVDGTCEQLDAVILERGVALRAGNCHMITRGGTGRI